MNTRRTRRASAPIPIDLALQGGGAHGAFTWGVLDRLLEEPGLRVDGISGTSAGAMNAAVLADGLAESGPEGSRLALERFWRRVSEAALLSPMRRGPLEVLTGTWSLDYSPLFNAVEMASRLMSPYDLGTMAGNPLRKILTDSIDFDRLARSPVRVFINTTNVRTGKGRVFRNAEVTVDALLASACLPTLFQAVEIGGDAYWDGGYSGNPSLGPLVRECGANDLILVQINPIERPGTPRSAREIHNRLNEISFNSPLIKELRIIAILRREIDLAGSESMRWARMHIHRIASSEMLEYGYSSKLMAEWAFFERLRDIGRRAAESFLVAHRADIGRRSTLDLDALLEGA
ncbi:MAG: patatin-like phospholipase family protein [Burkholderiales bacterium]|jgi:NTE family protein|nr:patatin-like phospholipase family protein [Burkholderiales bacterium]